MQAKIIERVVADLRSQSYGRDAKTGDAVLVDAFVACRDQTAFTALVQRHGPMVFGVCRRILGHTQDAEDAFQAVFLVLARKAHTVRPRAWIGNWLYGVAVRTALKARGLRRRRREHQVLAMPPQSTLPSDSHRDVQAILDEEIARLPDKYRLAVVLCDLEEQTRTEAAQQLGIPEGTLSSRLSTARRKLAKRLQVRGVTLAAGGVAVLLAENAASAAVPHNLLASAVQTASATALTSAAIATLAKGVITAMFLSKLKQVSAIALLLVVVLALGAGWGQLKAQPDAGQPAPRAATADPNEPAQLAQKVKPPPRAGHLPAGALDAVLGAWRVLRIDVRNDGVGGGGAAGPPGGGGLGPRLGGGGGGVGPMMPGKGGNHFSAFDSASGRAFLHLTENTAIHTNSGQRSTNRIKLGKGTIDWVLDNPEFIDPLKLGIYVLDRNQLRLHFGRNNGPRPKTAEDAWETWTLMRQPSRQEFYQKFDSLQGAWNAVSGEYNGEALLPRELVSVQLTIENDHWQMSPLKQPAQPDAVPAQFFGKPYQFVLDADGPRSILVLNATIGKGSMQVRILYELKGDELKLCWDTQGRSQAGFAFQAGQPREEVEPLEEFKTTPGSERVLFVLRRGKAQPPPPMGANPAGNPD